MRTRNPVALVAMTIAGFIAGGCSNDYFEGPRLNENPNKPSAALWSTWCNSAPRPIQGMPVSRIRSRPHAARRC